MGHLAWAYILGGLFPLVLAKGGPLVKNIDNVKFEMGPTFPMWPGLLPALHGPDIIPLILFSSLSLCLNSNEYGHVLGVCARVKNKIPKMKIRSSS